MPIIVNLDVVLAKRKMRSRELAERVGISEVNISPLKGGKVRGMRFEPSTRSARCCNANRVICSSGDQKAMPAMRRGRQAEHRSEPRTALTRGSEPVSLAWAPSRRIAAWRTPTPGQSSDPFVTVHLRNDEFEVQLFSMLTTIGTPLDVTAEELRIETYFPANEASERVLRQLAEREAAKAR